MSKTPYGMAMLITDENIEKLSIVNGGVVPALDVDEPVYFVLPYNHDFIQQIVGEEAFFYAYEFIEPEDDTCFVEIIER